MTWSFWMAWLVVSAGHAKLLAISENYLHSLRLPRPTLRRIRAVYDVLFFGVPVWFLCSHRPLLGDVSDSSWWQHLSAGWRGWMAWGGAGAFALAFSALRHLTRRPPACLADKASRVIDVAARTGQSLIGPGRASVLARLPRNQQFTLEINLKTFHLSRLPASWDGLTIVHFSDLHLRGTVARRYFEEVVHEAQALQGDLLAFTGDLLDSTACLDWIPATLGRLSAPLGCYFVLGNHDWYLPVLADIRSMLRDHGWVDLAGQVVEIRGGELPSSRFEDGNGRLARSARPPLVLAGNELPWMGTAPELSRAAPEAFRILLSHSPDQIDWARRHGVDLMLAGHTHGGQIQLPVLGPVYSPSRYSCRYAAGEFWRPPTLLHVSRGISGREPIRYRCRPELTKLVLRSRAGDSRD